MEEELQIVFALSTLALEKSWAWKCESFYVYPELYPIPHLIYEGKIISTISKETKRE